MAHDRDIAFFVEEENFVGVSAGTETHDGVGVVDGFSHIIDRAADETEDERHRQYGEEYNRRKRRRNKNFA